MSSEAEEDQKTEEPTGKRLGEARDEGQLAISREISSWALFVAVLVVVAYLGPDMASKLAQSLRVFLEMPHALSLEGRGLQGVLGSATLKAALATLLIFAILGVAVIAGTMVQTGYYFNTNRLKPDIMRAAPWKGFKQLFSVTSLVELGKSFVKLVVIGTLVMSVLWPLMDTLPSFVGFDLVAMMHFMHDEVVHLLILMLIVITVIAVADLVYQRYSYFKSLRMTKQEVKDENKQMEGDPVMKGRLRQIRLEKARKRMMAQVPRADVVITNPTHYAVALKYETGRMAAPVVLAKGADRVALRIREVAEEHDVPLVSNPPLARALYDTVEVDQMVKPEHYRAVAEVISYVFKLKKKIVPPGRP